MKPLQAPPLLHSLPQITKLKIDSNPFAKGFRDSSRLTDFERETMESMFESQFLRSHAAPSPRPAPPHPALPMFRPAPHAPALSLEGRALLLARSQLLRSSLPPPTRPLALPPLPNLWSQWVQLQQLNSQLLLARGAPLPTPALLSLVSRAGAETVSRSPSPLQVDM